MPKAASTDTALPESFYLTQTQRESLSPILRASLHIAERAHAGETRETKGQHIPYIHHVILAMNILKASGIQDEVALAAALLHDTLEQGFYDYHKKWSDREQKQFGTKEAFERAQLRAGERLEKHLIKAIRDEFMAPPTHFEKQKAEYLARETAGLILDIVKQLTNPPAPKERKSIDGTDITVEHKRFMQIDKAYKYTPRAKRVKMADMASTLIGDLLFESDKKPQSLNIMHNRTLTIACECDDARPELHQMIVNLVQLNHQILSAAPPARTRPSIAQFSLQDYITEHRHRYNNTIWVNEPGTITQGILSVEINPLTQKVEAFRIMDDPGREAYRFGLSDTLNHVKSELVNALGIDECRTMKLGTAGLFNSQFVARKVTMSPTISLEKFIKIATDNHAISQALIEQISIEINRFQERKQPGFTISPVLAAPFLEGRVTSGDHQLDLAARA